MLDFDKDGRLAEECYDISGEPKAASLFTTGNGYLGVRGSYEEFGHARVQGAYIRGLFDEIVEVMEPFSDNEYMRKYYFDEDSLKDFEKQDSCVNFGDFLTIRFFVGGKPFYPWEGKVVSWKRYLDVPTARLMREVTWDDGEGNLTEFIFERFASYSNRRCYAQSARAVPLNHNLDISVVSGADIRVRTGGQRVIKLLSGGTRGNTTLLHAKAGDKYNFTYALGVVNRFYSGGKDTTGAAEAYCSGGVYGNSIVFKGAKGQERRVEKLVYALTSRDESGDIAAAVKQRAEALDKSSYGAEFIAHKSVWQKYFSCFDIQIEGDPGADAAVRFANYHTAISADIDGSVHSLSAKSLSGERYNQFVWWDAEAYQIPPFTFTYPAAAKNCILYRYNTLTGAKLNAKAGNYKGAKYAFVSAVTGEERVWKYCRHPHLQVHINSDVAYSVINYFRVTGDEELVKDYGLEILIEIARYWVSRVTFKNNRYEILNVTGVDEHHPYVDNDAYTNYCVHFTLQKTLELIKKFPSCKGVRATGLTNGEIGKISEVAGKLFLPRLEGGLIPQFDGYFGLSRTLETAGNGTGKSFQMKQPGLYHKSQIIKQPDVALLFSFLDIEMDKSAYALNWDYYEKMCELSSSLSYPVHALCSADNGRMLSFYNYLMTAARMDIDDVYRSAWQGIHAGCAAGVFLAVFAGVLGIRFTENGITAEPKAVPWWKSVTMNFEYRGKRIFARLECGKIIFTSSDAKEITVTCNQKEYKLKNKLTVGLV